MYDGIVHSLLSIVRVSVDIQCMTKRGNNAIGKHKTDLFEEERRRVFSTTCCNMLQHVTTCYCCRR